MSERVLVVSAHPDDEVLGCGGTILKHRDRGDEIHWVVATVAHEPRWSAKEIDRKRLEVEKVAERYGVQRLARLGLPTILLDSLPLDEVVSAMRPAMDQARPDIVYVVNPHDVHTDHGVVFTAAWTLMKTFRAATLGPRRILAYETISSTEAAPPLRDRSFQPNAFSDISEHLEEKLEVAGLYGSEMQEEPLPRAPSAIRALARYRGATIGVEYAEGFRLLRDVF